MNENEKNFLSESMMKAGEEIKEQVANKFREALNSENPDPDPETVKMVEEIENEKADPNKLLLDVLENVRDAIVITIAEAKEWGVSTEQMLEVDEKINDLAETALDIYRAMEAKRGLGEARSMLDKLHFMREVEQRNDERIKEWSEKQ